MAESTQDIIKALEQELNKDQAISEVLGRAIELAKEYGINACDLTLCFAEACINAKKLLHASMDAWFEHDFRYAEIEFGGIRTTWGEL